VSNPSKAKGTRAETAVANYLREQGWPAVERRALAGSSDKGDIAGLRDLVVEVKACKAMDLGGWLREAGAEALNAGADFGIVFAKRRGKADPADWYVVMRGSDLVQLLKEAGR
jgi:hypothetical protein